MERLESKRTIHVAHVSMDECEERAVDTDIVLPDYYPDIAVILKCMMFPRITNSFYNNHCVSIDGNTTIRVLYLSDDRTTLHCHESTVPFTAVFRADEPLHFEVDTKNDYINCRATGPRRLDIHGAFRVCLKVISNEDIQLFKKSNDLTVFCRTKKVVYNMPVSQVNKNFTLSETIGFGANIERLLCTDAAVVGYECKILTNKLIVKGTLAAKMLYCVDGALNEYSQDIPFSQIVDVDGMSEDKTCRLKICVSEVQGFLKQNESALSEIDLNVKLSTYVYTGCNETIEIVQDAYSVECPLLCETAPITIPVCNGNEQYEKSTVKMISDIPDHISSVISIWGELKTCDVHREEGGDRLQCCVLLGMIVQDNDGHLGYIEKTLDGETHMSCVSDKNQIKLLNISGVVISNQIHTQLEIEKTASCLKNESMNAVVNVIEESSKPFQKNDATIRIVYAEQGDNIWDIAKEHHSCVESILKENDMQNEQLQQRMMLMVPLL